MAESVSSSSVPVIELTVAESSATVAAVAVGFARNDSAFGLGDASLVDASDELDGLRLNVLLIKSAVNFSAKTGRLALGSCGLLSSMSSFLLDD